MRKQSGFTLIELLTVIAITAVLMTLIILPIAQSFNLVRAAQGFAEAQDKARTLVERIAREISNSAGIRDNAGSKGFINVVVPGQDGTQVTVTLPYAKLDIIKPAEGDPGLVGPSSVFINPNTGREDPTLRTPKGQVVLPVTPGNTITRYFIGRRDPFANYNNPYDGLLMRRGVGRDNLYVLYKIEVQPYIWTSTGYRVNNAYFYDQERDNDPNTSGPLFDDPNFFDPVIALPAYAQGPFAGQAADPTKADMVRNWLSRARIVTEVSRYDMVQPIFNKQSRKVTYDNNLPRLVSLVQFKPTGVGNEPTVGQTAVRLSEETDNSSAVAPDVYRTKFSSWSSLTMRVYPDGTSPVLNNAYQIGRIDPVTNLFTVVYYDPTVHLNERTDGINLFNAGGYLDSVKRNAPYPFTSNLYLANLTPLIRQNMIAMVADMDKGMVRTSFPIEEVGLAPRTDLSPTVDTGQPFSPQNDPGLAGAWNQPQFQPSDPLYVINSAFNKVWAEQLVVGGPINYGLQPDVHRFIDLRVVPFSDGSFSPLHPDTSIGFARARIVPGSEVIYGPDQLPGPNFGERIRYHRVTKNPGPNQYRLNYVDLPEPTNPTTNLVDYSLLAPGMPNPPAAYDANNFISSVIQPRFKAGYLQLNNDPNVPLPNGNIEASYRFQLNGANDVLTADYDSRQLMNVLLTIRNYPQTSVPNPQTITLQATATTRNVVR